jgi:cytochrome P450
MLLAARDEETGEAMPHGLVRDEVMTLLLAGHETTAVALSWAWWELARDPRARAALDGELGSPAGRQALAEADWNGLPFTRAVVAESMRLHPPAYMLGRRPAETLEIEGYRVRKGSVLLISTYALHRDPRWWGEDAAAFRPGRWLDGEGRFDEGNPGQPRGAYLPFGAGSRMCIGSGFAVMEAVLLLARLATDWRVEVDPGFAVRMQPAVTLRPRAIPATLRRTAPAG